MGKTGKWLRRFLTGKKDEKKEKSDDSLYSPILLTKSQSSSTSVPAPKEKKRWSFRRSADSRKSSNSPELSISLPVHGLLEAEMNQKRHAMAVAVATAAAADAAVAAAQAAVAAMRLTSGATRAKASAIEEAAAIRIQSAFRAYLARKALCALRGLVKLQALARGHLVRKQTAATLRCMHVLVTAREQARAQRIRMVNESLVPQQRSIHRRSPLHPRSRLLQDMDRNTEEKVKIVEVDLDGLRNSTRSRSSYSTAQIEPRDPFCGQYSHCSTPSRADQCQQFLLASSALTEMSPRAYSGHFENFSFTMAQSSPQSVSALTVPDPTQSPYDCHLFPNYMANTESSRAKARSQSAPKQRTDAYEQQTIRRRTPEGRNIPRGIKMQRSSSHAGMVANGYHYPWSIKLDKSNMSLKDSECGSTSTVLTNTSYCRSLAEFEFSTLDNVMTIPTQSSGSFSFIFMPIIIIEFTQRNPSGRQQEASRAQGDHLRVAGESSEGMPE
ncbi:protein IQ-DOMAIN 14 [Canna indica]|uniref:Protein IQ-DOMAIN 14 n=1 Tax=Canna indica TaxID=4628 RepID=A0AAQ3KCG9_9LILI|nr:protein IQ-DOMAIN 14 [Canna indica]